MRSLESSLIQRLRLSDGASRIELARAMELAPSTVGLYVDRLIDQGFLREGAKSRLSAGRPRVTLELNPKAGYFVGIEFEARQLSAIALDFSNRTLKRQRQTLRATDTAETVLSKIEEAIDAVSARGKRLLGVGVAVPGTVDNEQGVAVHYEFIRNWRNVRIAERLGGRFAVPISLENNVRSMALAERWFGLARAVENFVCLGIRSGIGAGVVVQGELYRGENNFAGEIGGWSCLSDKSSTPTTLEQLASVRAILNQLAEAIGAGRKSSLSSRPSRALTVDDLLRAARDGDLLVHEKLHAAAEMLGRTICQMSLLLNPRMVIIAGPLADLGDLFLEPMRKAAARDTPALHARTPRIVASQLGDFSGALGAAAMSVHQWEPSL
jgi:predicted NBD/HSP70 family sugar kinase